MATRRQAGRAYVAIVTTLALVTGTPAIARVDQSGHENRRNDLQDVVATEVAAAGILLTSRGVPCPAEQVRVSYVPIPARDIRLGGYAQPLVAPDPVSGTRATGLVTCGADSHSVVGFDADWEETGWTVWPQPVDDIHDVEAVNLGSLDTSSLERGLDDDVAGGPHLATSATATVTFASVHGVASRRHGDPVDIPVPEYPSDLDPTPDPLADYDGQDQCWPVAKPGTVALGELLATTYVDNTEVRISRNCNVGNRSEHKEGRALDWFVDWYDPAQRAIGDRLTQWMTQPDPAGNAYGGARRLGVMYMIWNRQLWSPHRADDGWREYTGPSPHTDHVHFSLSWDGAWCETSWWRATDCMDQRVERVERIAGDTRIDTSIALSETAFHRTDAVILARDDEFPDALSAASLAAALHAPLLLNPPDGLSSDVADEISRLEATTAYVVGGLEAIGEDVVAELEEVGLKVERLGGETRLDTAVLVAMEVATLTTDTTNVVVARSDRFADALTAANLAAATGAPILLTPSDTLAPETRALVTLLAPERVFLVGGPIAVSDEVEAELAQMIPIVHRLAGRDRYDTALAVAAAAQAYGLGLRPTLLASGAEFADALSAGTAAIGMGGSLLLVDPSGPDANVALLEHLMTAGDEIDFVYIVGGDQAIDPRIDDAVAEAIRHGNE